MRTAPAHAQTEESRRRGIDVGKEECGAAGSGPERDTQLHATKPPRRRSLSRPSPTLVRHQSRHGC
eukprot:6579084-Prymnesium_polylepis.1